MTRRKHGNNLSTTITTGISAASLSITVTSAAGFPSIGSGEVIYATLISGIKREIIIITDDASTPTFTITRAAEGTTAQAFAAGSTIEIRTTANSHDRKQDQIATSGDVIDFGSADSFEIPNGAAPTVNAAGEIALDTNIPDHTGLIKYHDGIEELVIPALPLANLTSVDGDVIAYNATTNEFEMVAQSGGGGSLADGDYGDVTISGSGTAITVDLPASVAPATDDKIYLFDTSDADNKKHCTAQEIAALGGWRSRQVFTSGGTWNRPTGIKRIRVWGVSGGGGGGSAITTDEAAGSGGGAGGYFDKIIDVSAISSVTVTIGAGGAGGTTGGTAPVAGGTSSFGAHCQSTGGGAGVNGSTLSDGAGGAGGVASGGDINVPGGPGDQSHSGLFCGPAGYSFFGGVSAFKRASAGITPTGIYGAGGGGGHRTTGSGNVAGGAGIGGIIIVEEFA